MKVPKMYKSSDLYDAGTDVIYDDDSKLQYAPFIYATTKSSDSGGDDDGGDEEGEDTMVIKFDADNDRYDKTWQDVLDAVKSGKTVICVADNSPLDAPDTNLVVYYACDVLYDDEGPEGYEYIVFLYSYDDSSTVQQIAIGCASPTDYLVEVQMG